MQEIRLKLKGKYNGHNIKASGVVNLDFAFEYTELVQVIPLVQLLNNSINIISRVEGKTLKLGSYMLGQVTIASDGSSKIRFNSIVDTVEADNLNELFGSEIQLQIRGKIELEDEANE